jgi:hypothetical protein
MFINDLDVLNANLNGTLYRTTHGAGSTTTTTNGLQSYDTALHLQSNANSLTFACQQKCSSLNAAPNGGYGLSPSMPQTTISYSTSRQDLAPSSNLYSSSIYSSSDTSASSNNAMSNLIPFNITIYNPSLSCNYTQGIQNQILTTPQFPQMTTIPNFSNFNTFPQKCMYFIRKKLVYKFFFSFLLKIFSKQKQKNIPTQ